MRSWSSVYQSLFEKTCEVSETALKAPCGSAFSSGRLRAQQIGGPSSLRFFLIATQSITTSHSEAYLKPSGNSRHHEGQFNSILRGGKALMLFLIKPFCKYLCCGSLSVYNTEST